MLFTLICIVGFGPAMLLGAPNDVSYQNELAKNARDAAEFQWEAFKIKYGKKYDTDEKEKIAKLTFFDKLKLVSENNLKFEQKEVSFTMGLNQFSDLTSEEFAKHYLGLKRPN